MPREIEGALLNHIIGTVTTLSHLWEITCQDTTVFRYTDADIDITYGGNTFNTLNSGTLSGIEQQSTLSPDNFDFSVILNENDINKDDIVAGKFDYADVKIYLVNRESPSDGAVKILSGKLGQVEITNDNEASIEFRSLTQLLQQSIGRTYLHECDADLGDTRCGVTLASYTYTGTVSSVSSNISFADSSIEAPNDFFSYGLLTWTSGNNNGLSMEVKDFAGTGGVFELISPMPFTVQAGDTYSVYRGCDKIKETCRDTFDNIINFRGFAEIPGPDILYKVPDVNPDAGLHE